MPRSMRQDATVRPLWIQLSDIMTATTSNATLLDVVFNMTFPFGKSKTPPQTGGSLVFGCWEHPPSLQASSQRSSKRDIWCK